MRRSVTLGLLVLTAACFLIALDEPTGVDAQAGKWLKTLPAALIEAKKTGKPILLEFR